MPLFGSLVGGSGTKKLFDNTIVGSAISGQVPGVVGQAFSQLTGGRGGGSSGGMSLEDIDAEIAQLEAQIAQQPQQATFQPPQAPGLPGGEILQNPLLRAIQDDVTRRVFANQASAGRGGAGETAVALQNALAPTALNLGLTLQGRQQAQQQQNTQNLMNLFGIGSNVAAGQGSSGISGAGAIGSALQAGGLAQAQGALGRGQAISGGLGNLAGLAGFLGGGGSFGGGATGFGLGGGLPFQPTASASFIA